MNKNNCLGLSPKRALIIVDNIVGNGKNCTLAIPTYSRIAKASSRGAYIVEVQPNGSFTAHWLSNWNTNGDFRTELMTFNNNLELIDNRLERNAVRAANGLMPIAI